MSFYIFLALVGIFVPVMTYRAARMKPNSVMGIKLPAHMLTLRCGKRQIRRVLNCLPFLDPLQLL